MFATGAESPEEGERREGQVETGDQKEQDGSGVKAEADTRNAAFDRWVAQEAMESIVADPEETDRVAQDLLGRLPSVDKKQLMSYEAGLAQIARMLKEIPSDTEGVLAGVDYFFRERYGASLAETTRLVLEQTMMIDFDAVDFMKKAANGEASKRDYAKQVVRLAIPFGSWIVRGLERDNKQKLHELGVLARVHADAAKVVSYILPEAAVATTPVGSLLERAGKKAEEISQKPEEEITAWEVSRSMAKTFVPEDPEEREAFMKKAGELMMDPAILESLGIPAAEADVFVALGRGLRENPGVAGAFLEKAVGVSG